MRLRTHLILLVLAALVPLVIFTCINIYRDLTEQREILDRGMRNTVRALSLAIDGEVKTSLGILETLAASTFLDTADFERFHEFASRAVTSREGAYIVLFDASGQQVVNTARPLGTSLPNPLRQAKPPAGYSRYPLIPLGGPAPVRKVLESGQPVVSDLFVALSTERPSIGIHIPVLRDGTIRYVLDMVIEPEPLVQVLLAHGLPEDSVAALLDGNGVIIARTRNPSAHLGQRLAPELAAQVSRADEGTGKGLTREGLAVTHAFTRSRTTGWTLSLGVSESVISAPLGKTVRFLVGGAALAAVLGIGVALLVGIRISRPISLLAGSAGAMARGERVELNVGEVRELRELHGALVSAGEGVRVGAAEHDRRLVAEESEKALRSADRAKDEFLAMLSHELRNPLAALTTAAHVIKTSPPDKPAAAEARDIVERQTRHMARLIEDLLDISRVTMGKLALERERIDLAVVAASVVDAWRSEGRMEDRRVTVFVRPAWIDADRSRLEQIIGNLLDNALKYSPSGRPVSLSVREEGAEAVLEVADHGEGIAPELIDHVFDLFVQGTQGMARSQGGLGIGLALVKRLVEMHGGSVSVASEGTGRGAVFALRLPSVARPLRKPTAGPAARQAVMPRSVLIIEDNNDTRQMLRAALVLEGYEVSEAADGAAGLAAAAQSRPHVALIDIGLPDIDGYELARRLRAGQADGAVKLIAVTGYGQVDDRQRALEAGFDAHLTKPVTPERLAQVIATWAES